MLNQDQLLPQGYVSQSSRRFLRRDRRRKRNQLSISEKPDLIRVSRPGYSCLHITLCLDPRVCTVYVCVCLWESEVWSVWTCRRARVIGFQRCISPGAREKTQQNSSRQTNTEHQHSSPQRSVFVIKPNWKLMKPESSKEHFQTFLASFSV